MGMSAGQARLLSITAKLTDNELRSQMLTNSKLRLADKSTEASNKYMDALNSQQLMYTSYDGSGNKLTEALTANTILTFADLKNQYAMVNTAGQVLVAGSDIKNFKASKTMADFMYAYGIEKVDNPKYPEALMNIYGKTTLADNSYLYETLYDEENPLGWADYLDKETQTGIDTIRDILENNDKNTLTMDHANQIAGIVSGWANLTGVAEQKLSNYADIGGSFGNYVYELLNIPSTFPNEDDYRSDEGTKLANNFNLASKPCYQNAMGTSRGCYIHVLAHLLDLHSSDITETAHGDPTVSSSWGSTYNTTVGGKTITTSDGNISGSAIQTADLTESMAPVSEYICANNGNNVLAPAKGDEITPDSALVDKLLSNYKLDADGNMVQKTFKEKIIDLYYVVENFESDPDLKKNDGSKYTYAELKEYLKNFQEDMEETLNIVTEEYYEAIDSWKNSLLYWLDRIEAAKNVYIEDIKNVPAKQIPDETDSRYQWYKNLWYRMGGISEKEKDDSGRHYKELDPNLLNNAEWLEFALEHGVITLEQAQFNKDGSVTYPNMGTYDWTSIIYTNAADIVSQEDSAAIALAEVEYENAVRDIENEDKKIDQDLKKLDTEHSALQTEYDSIKSVIDKNVERSFKAFS